MPHPPPVDPVTSMGEAANSLHELFTEYQRAGFRRSEALELVKEHIRSAVTMPPPAPPES
jgi:hypothetical protein